jgi:alpha-1,3-rhamnosyl/mannosyltransferase
MRIALDARWIFPEITGIGAYTRELIRHLPPLDPGNDYVLLFSDPALRDRTLAETGSAAFPNVTARLVPFGVFSPWGQIRLPALLRRERIDVYHSPNYLIPLLAFPRKRAHKTRCLVTIHDVIPLLFPDAAPRSRKSRLFPVYRRLMLDIAARADAIVADSEASRTDVVRELRIPPDRTGKARAIYCGVGERFFNAAETPRDASAPPTLLYVGRSDPYKNLAGLIEAFALAHPRYPQPARGRAALGVPDAVTWQGYLTDAALVQTYRQATALVLPSRYEGFGLPVVEAMACGTPVLCNDIPVLREIANEAALFVNADDVPSFGEAIVRMVTDAPLRARLTAQGLARARQFTWEETARRTIALYRELGNP